MNKRPPVLVYRLFSSLSNKQILFDSFQQTPCRLNSYDFSRMIIILYALLIKMYIIVLKLNFFVVLIEENKKLLEVETKPI